jgi:hypothetical protein
MGPAGGHGRWTASGQSTPDAMPGLRHNATPYIVPMYQFDISGRWFALAWVTRELR